MALKRQSLALALLLSMATVGSSAYDLPSFGRGLAPKLPVAVSPQSIPHFGRKMLSGKKATWRPRGPPPCEGNCVATQQQCGGARYRTSVPCCNPEDRCVSKNKYFAQCIGPERKAANVKNHGWAGDELTCSCSKLEDVLKDTGRDAATPKCVTYTQPTDPTVLQLVPNAGSICSWWRTDRLDSSHCRVNLESLDASRHQKNMRVLVDATETRKRLQKCLDYTDASTGCKRDKPEFCKPQTTQHGKEVCLPWDGAVAGLDLLEEVSAALKDRGLSTKDCTIPTVYTPDHRLCEAAILGTLQAGGPAKCPTCIGDLHTLSQVSDICQAAGDKVQCDTNFNNFALEVFAESLPA